MRGYDNWKLRSDRDDWSARNNEPDIRPCPVTGFDCITCGDDCRLEPQPLGDVAQAILDRLRRKMEQRKNERSPRRDKADR